MRPYAPQKAGLLPVELMTDVEAQRRVLDTPFQDLVLNNLDVELDNILAKIENQEDLTEKEIDDAKKYLDQIFYQVINSNITQQGKNIVSQYLELVENTIDNYENIITTKTVTVVETKVGTYAERGAIKKRVSEYSTYSAPSFATGSGDLPVLFLKLPSTTWSAGAGFPSSGSSVSTYSR